MTCSYLSAAIAVDSFNFYFFHVIKITITYLKVYTGNIGNNRRGGNFGKQTYSEENFTIAKDGFEPSIYGL